MAKTLPSFDVSAVDPAWKIAIVRGAWHGELTEAMARDAADTLRKAGIPEANVSIEVAAGSFEIPLAAKWLIDERKPDGVLAFGVIVQGETHHAQSVASAATQGLMSLQLATGTPIINEILFVANRSQAEARATGDRATGTLAAQTLLHSLALRAKMHS